MKWPGIVGTIAGDNTLLVITKSVEDAQEIIKRFKALVKS